MKISIIGLGKIGLELGKNLSTKHIISGTSRDADKLSQIPFLTKGEILTSDTVPSSEMLDTDVIVLNIPPFENQLTWFRSWDWNFKTKLIFLSTIGVYELNAGVVEANTRPIYQSKRVHDLISLEKWVLHNFPTSTILRLGGLFSDERHPGKVLAGKDNLSHGDAPINLVHHLDVVGFIETLLVHDDWSKIYNLVYPFHPLKRDYYQSYAQKNGLVPPSFKNTGREARIVSDENAEKIYKFKYPL